MNKIIIIIGLVLLSGTHAQAANYPSDVSAMQQLENLSIISGDTTNLVSPKTGRPDMAITEDGKSNTVNMKRNIRLIITENDPAPPAPPDRGSPDSRGGR